MNIYKLEKYLNDFEIDLIKNNYANDYYESVCDSEYFDDNIKLLLSYNLSFLGDILYYYLNILEVPTDILSGRLKGLINILGNEYVVLIDNNIELLEPVVKDY